jgi:hypothetical protein
MQPTGRRGPAFRAGAGLLAANSGSVDLCGREEDRLQLICNPLDGGKAISNSRGICMLYILHVFLALAVFSTVLNGFLRGSKKQQIDVSLSFVLVGLLAAVLVG